MSAIAVYEKLSGKVLFIASSSVKNADIYETGTTSYAYVGDDFRYSPSYVIESDGEKTLLYIEESPSVAHEWDWETKQWVHNLSEARAQAWARIKSARESVEFGPFVWGGQTFDGDSESQRRIQGAAQLATLAQATGQPFSIDWTLADNTQATLTAAEMIGVGMALGQHVNGAHGIARTLRTQIDAATTPEELEAIQWPA